MKNKIITALRQIRRAFKITNENEYSSFQNLESHKYCGQILSQRERFNVIKNP